MQKRIEIPLGAESFDPNSHVTEEIRWDAPNLRFIKKVTSATLTLHLPAREDSAPAVLICPGGVYGGVSIDKEGHHFADWLSARGVAGAVLKYRMPCPPSPHLPFPVVDFFQALEALADYDGIDPRRVVFAGFSAGGHLAGLCAVRFAELARKAGFAGPPPAGVALLYPVVSMREGFSHGGSRANLIGSDAGPAETDFYSMETGVGAASPPLFLVHAEDDKGVPIANSELLASRYREAGKPMEFLTYPEGGHGFGMAVGRKPLGDWVPAFGAWLDSLS